MSNRLREMHRLLKPIGILCVHLDYKAVHYIKVELDKIFGQGSPDRGAKHFVNEVIYSYKRWTNVSSNFQKLHDNILIYSKSKKYNFNKQFESARDVRHWKLNTVMDRKKRINQIIIYDKKETEKAFKENRIKFKKEDLRIVYKEKNKVVMGDVWDLGVLSSNAPERVNYATQKPLRLLDRVIETFTNENDIVADFFCGCGTTLSSAQSLNRKWLGVDVSKEASKVIRKRMARDHQMKIEIVPLKSLTKEQIMRLNPWEFEKYCVRSIGGIPNEVQRGDGGIDGFMQDDGTPIQVKKSERVGRNVIDNFHKHLQKNGKGIIIAKSFGKGAKDEVARLKLEEGYDVSLVTVDDVLRDAS